MPVVLQLPVVPTAVPLNAMATTAVALVYVPDVVSAPLEALWHDVRKDATVPLAAVAVEVIVVLASPLESAEGAVVEPDRNAKITTRSPEVTALSVQEVAV